MYLSKSLMKSGHKQEDLPLVYIEARKNSKRMFIRTLSVFLVLGSEVWPSFFITLNTSTGDLTYYRGGKGLCI